MTQIFCIINGGFLLIESYESTATNKIFKTLLWGCLCKVKYVVLLTFKVSLIDNLTGVYERLGVLFKINSPKIFRRAFENEIT